MSRINKLIFLVTLFAIAMAFMESSVVIYLRELYYKSGFNFPLKIIPAFIGKVEFYRELCTVIMLIIIGILAGKTHLQRFSFFILAFAVWDIFYYVFLYVCLSWPQSLNTWDILFLIPVPWVGPVWTPCALSLLMVIGSLFVIYKTERNSTFQIPLQYWWMLISGSFICIVAFMWDYLAFTFHKEKNWSILSNQDLFSEIENYVPKEFNYGLFMIGFILMVSSVGISILKTIKIKKK